MHMQRKFPSAMRASTKRQGDARKKGTDPRGPPAHPASYASLEEEVKESLEVAGDSSRARIAVGIGLTKTWLVQRESHQLGRRSVEHVVPIALGARAKEA
jgi:hypothetical protein